MKHLLLDVYQVALNKSTRVKIGSTSWAIDFPYTRMYIVKKSRKNNM
jgi:hypothetical protein